MKLTYRPEIDGLRTIAVMLVILHHLGWSVLSGGYVGVDVFFVISGYLITAILYSEIKSGSFSVARFYKRRIIRLAPAYFLVLAATSITALVLMLPAEILNYAQSAIYSTFFLANFFMWREVGGYFGTQSDFVPLLHLWSLAVEEQFYIFWPLVLFAAYRFIGRRFILTLVLGGIFIGVIISDWGVQNYRAAAYYLLPTRFFELMVGALLAALPRFEKPIPVVREALGATGLTLILYAATNFSTERLFPGFSALVPCIGTALVIQFARQGQGSVGKFLSMSPLVYLGKISYPAYLWHWPIIAFLNLNLIKIDLAVGTLTLAATLLLSGLTYRYAERPFQRMNAFRFPSVLGIGFAAPATAVLCFAIALKSFDGFPARYSDDLNIKSAALQSFANKTRGRCNEGPIENPLSEDECVLGVADRQVDFLLIGDSHANHFTAMLDVMAKDAGIRGYDITQSQTIYLAPAVKRYYEQDGRVIEHKNFSIRNTYLTKLIAEKKYKGVILAGSFANYYNEGDLRLSGRSDSDTAFEQGLRVAIRNIVESGAAVLIVTGSPILKAVTHDCTMKNVRFGLTSDCTLSQELHRAHFKKFESLLGKLKEEFPEIIWIDPAKIICDETICNTEIAGIPLYRDSRHLNNMGSALIGKRYINQFGNPLSVLRSASSVARLQ